MPKSTIRFLHFISCNVVAATLGCVSAAHANDDSMCDALRDFADSVSGSEVYEVTLFTDWGTEPTIACGRSEKPSEIAFCGYLVDNSSIEFMTVNVERVLACAGVDLPQRSALRVENLTGTVVSHDPAFTEKAVDMVVTFDTTSDDRLPSLTISMSKRIDEE